jgi:hypothetical protein
MKICLIALAVIALFAMAATADDSSLQVGGEKILYVDCDKGSDSGKGTETKPYATLVKATKQAKSGVTLRIKVKGTCTPTDFNTGDQALVYFKWGVHKNTVLESWGSKKATLSGGLPLKKSAWQKVSGSLDNSLIDSKVKNKLVAINLETYKPDGKNLWYGKAGSAKAYLKKMKMKNAPWPACAVTQPELVFDGEPMDIARFPDNEMDMKAKYPSVWKNWALIGSVKGTESPKKDLGRNKKDSSQFWFFPSFGGRTVGKSQCKSKCESQKECIAACERAKFVDSKKVKAFEEKVAKWGKEPNMFVQGYFGNEWADDWLSVKEVKVLKADEVKEASWKQDKDWKTRPEGKIMTTVGVTFQTPPRYGVGAGARFRIVNALSELTAKGEYFLDVDNAILYFYPPSKLTDNAHLSMLKYVVRTKQDGVTVQNLNIVGAVSQAVYAVEPGKQVSHFTMKNNHIGPNARGGAATEGFNNLIEGNTITRTGCYGLMVNGGDATTLKKSGNVVTKNLFSRSGRVSRTYQPHVRWGGVGHVFTHNEMKESPHACMYGKGNDNMFENNKFHDCVQEASDMGAFYTGQSLVQRGNTVRRNSFWNNHNVVEPFLRKSHVACVYLDDMQAGYDVYENTMVNSQYAYCSNGGRDNKFTKNVIVHCHDAILLNNAGQAWGFLNERCNASLAEGKKESEMPRYIKEMHKVKYDKPPYNKYKGILTPLAKCDGGKPFVYKKNMGDADKQNPKKCHDSCAPEGNLFTENQYCEVDHWSTYKPEDLAKWAPANPTKDFGNKKLKGGNCKDCKKDPANCMAYVNGKGGKKGKGGEELLEALTSDIANE